MAHGSHQKGASAARRKSAAPPQVHGHSGVLWCAVACTTAAAPALQGHAPALRSPWRRGLNSSTSRTRAAYKPTRPAACRAWPSQPLQSLSSAAWLQDHSVQSPGSAAKIDNHGVRMAEQAFLALASCAKHHPHPSPPATHTLAPAQIRQSHTCPTFLPLSQMASTEGNLYPECNHKRQHVAT